MEVCLLNFAEDFGKILQGIMKLKKVPTQVEIGNMTSISRKTVSRVLSEFQRKDLIQNKNREITIPDYKNFHETFV